MTSLKHINVADRWNLPTITNNKIHVLVEGYSTPYMNKMSRANCSCVLITAPNNVNIIVDTMSAWDGDRIKEELKKHNIFPNDISHVVCTHGHPDHVGCNYLFTTAELHIVGINVFHRNKYFDENFSKYDYEITEGVRIIQTQGHTSDCISVIVKGHFEDQENAVVAVTGDLFEKQEDIENPNLWMEVGNPDLREIQVKSRYEVINNAHYIIPGHGKPFLVKKNHISMLEAQFIS